MYIGLKTRGEAEAWHCAAVFYRLGSLRCRPLRYMPQAGASLGFGWLCKEYAEGGMASLLALQVAELQW
jgi:hypothetical protein